MASLAPKEPELELEVQTATPPISKYLRDAPRKPLVAMPKPPELTTGAFGSDTQSVFIESQAQAARHFSHQTLAVWGVSAETQEEWNILGRGDPWTKELVERAKSAPARQMPWLGMWRLGRCDPEAAKARFEEIKALARADVQSGYCAISDISITGISSPIAAARSVALREDLIATWQPVNTLERLLIDQLVQLHSLFEQCLHEFAYVSSRRADEVEYRIELAYDYERAREIKRMGSSDDRERDKWIPPRISVAQAIEHAAARMDQVHRMLLRTQRALRDMRRYMPPVVIQNVGQMNLAHQQLNVSAPGETGKAPRAHFNHSEANANCPNQACPWARPSETKCPRPPW